MPFTVNPKEFAAANVRIDVTGSIEWPDKAVTEKELAEKLTVVDITKTTPVTLEYKKDYTITAIDDNNKIGDATVTLSGAEGSKYDNKTMTAKVAITAKSLKNAKVELKNNALAYTGEAFTKIDPSLVKVYFDEENVVDPKDYTVAVTGEGTEVGTKVSVKVTAVDVKDGGHYTDSANDVAAEITQADISNHDVFVLEGLTDQYLYDAEEGVKQTGLKLKDTRTEKYVEIAGEDAYVYANNKAVGTATVTVKAVDTKNYTNEAVWEFQVLAATEANVELKAGIAYTGKDLTVEEVIDKVTDKNGKALKGWTAAFVGDHKNAGQGVVEVTLAGGNKITQVFEIKKAEIKAADVTVEGEQPFTYTGSVIRPKTKVVVNGTTLEEGKDYRVLNTEKIQTGKMNLVVEGLGNYTGAVAKDFEVGAASLAGAKVTNVKANYKYTGEVVRPEAKVTLNGKKLVKGKDYQLLNTEDVSVGEKDLVVLGMGGYKDSVLVNFTVKPVKAEVSVEAGEKQLTVKVKKQSGARYQVKYRVKGTDEWTSVNVKAGKVKKVLKELESGKKYQVKARAYVTVDGERVNGAWSAVKVSGKVK